MNRLRGFEQVIEKKKHNVMVMSPRRADVGSCAYDFYSPINITISPNNQILIWTDIKAYMQPDEVLILNVRSSQGKPRIQLANTQGWIDSNYYNNPDNEGNIGIFLRNEGTEDYIINAGDKICQGMFINYLMVDNDEPISQMRLGGFGSSGK
jgi:dUTP pyrophosphatase